MHQHTWQREKEKRINTEEKKIKTKGMRETAINPLL